MHQMPVKNWARSKDQTLSIIEEIKLILSPAIFNLRESNQKYGGESLSPSPSPNRKMIMIYVKIITYVIFFLRRWGKFILREFFSEFVKNASVIIRRSLTKMKSQLTKMSYKQVTASKLLN